MNISFMTGLFLLGVGIGMVFPRFDMLNVINPYIWLVFLVAGVGLIIKGQN